jgi:hypothetical protein
VPGTQYTCNNYLLTVSFWPVSLDHCLSLTPTTSPSPPLTCPVLGPLPLLALSQLLWVGPRFPGSDPTPGPVGVTFAVTGALSELQISYVCREVLQVRRGLGGPGSGQSPDLACRHPQTAVGPSLQGLAYLHSQKKIHRDIKVGWGHQCHRG